MNVRQFVYLRCHVCGAKAGRWVWFHRKPVGHGICADCAADLWKEDPEKLQNGYGVAGINWDGSEIGHRIQARRDVANG